MTGEITVSREPHGADAAAEFYDEVAHGSADDGDYPYIYKVEITGLGTFYGFKTGLPRSREPWTAGFVSFTRDTVFDADTGLKVDEESTKELVNQAIEVLGDQP